MIAIPPARLIERVVVDAELALQLHFMLSSESMGNHDSGYDEWRRIC